MNTNNQAQPKLSIFKKTVLSVVVLSAVTGGLLLLEDYRTKKSANKFADTLSQYAVPIKSEQGLSEHDFYFKESTDDSFLTTDTNELAKIAEQNLVAKSSTFINTEQALTSNDSTIDIANKSQSTDEMDKTETVKSIESINVLFDLSSASIAPEYKLTLVDMADQIKQASKDKQWQVVGHTDKSGRATFNLNLAKKRAQNVALFLIDQGVDETQLVLVTLGEYEASTLTNSTYNSDLRRVEVAEYQPEIVTLANKVYQRNQKNEANLKTAELLANKKMLEKQDSVNNSIVATLTEKVEANANAFTLTELQQVDNMNKDKTAHISENTAEIEISEQKSEGQLLKEQSKQKESNDITIPVSKIYPQGSTVSEVKEPLVTMLNYSL